MNFIRNLTNIEENVPSLMKKCFHLSNSTAIELFDSAKDEDLLFNKNLEILNEGTPTKKANDCAIVSTKSTTDVDEEKICFKSFQILKLLGSGAFGKVYLAQKKHSDQIYALKVLKKRQLISKNQVRYAIAEVNILKKMSHPFVLNLYYSFQVYKFIYLF